MANDSKETLPKSSTGDSGMKKPEEQYIRFCEDCHGIEWDENECVGCGGSNWTYWVQWKPKQESPQCVPDEGELIEKIAKTLYENEFGMTAEECRQIHGYERLGWENEDESDRNQFRHQARAVRLTLTTGDVIAEAAKMPDYYGANKRLADEIHKQRERIKELEAEVERLTAENAELRSWAEKDPTGMASRMLELFETRRESDRKVKELEAEVDGYRAVLDWLRAGIQHFTSEEDQEQVRHLIKGIDEALK